MHTGERCTSSSYIYITGAHTLRLAYVCQYCNRRFGVASNCNRHLKICKLAPIGEVDSSSSESDEPSAITSSANQYFPKETLVPAPKSLPSPVKVAARTIAPRPLPNTDGLEHPTPSFATKVPTEAELISSRRDALRTSELEPRPLLSIPQARKRSHNSHSEETWIPASLLHFNFLPFTGCAPLPLPPVRPHIIHDNVHPTENFSLDVDGKTYVWEERDSYDLNVHPTPYHPYVLFLRRHS